MEHGYQEFMGATGFYWWQGVVEDRQDPLKLGRCRVRVLGWHPVSKSLVKTEDLPWATPLQPLTSAAMGGIGTTPLGPVEGTWVMGFFRDGESGQEPVFMGTLGGFPELGGAHINNKDVGFTAPAQSDKQNIESWSGIDMVPVYGTFPRLNFVYKGADAKTQQGTATKALIYNFTPTDKDLTSHKRGDNDTNRLARNDTKITANTSVLTSTLAKIGETKGLDFGDIVQNGINALATFGKSEAMSNLNEIVDNAVKTVTEGAKEFSQPLAATFNEIQKGGRQLAKVPGELLKQGVDPILGSLNELTASAGDALEGSLTQLDLDFDKKAFLQATNAVGVKALDAVTNKITSVGSSLLPADITKASEIVSLIASELNITDTQLLQVMALSADAPKQHPIVSLKTTGRDLNIPVASKASGTSAITSIVGSVVGSAVGGIANSLLPTNNLIAEANTAFQTSMKGITDAVGLSVKADAFKLPSATEALGVVTGEVVGSALEVLGSAVSILGWSEPENPYATVYPYNHVYETESGHIVEFDDTPGHERIHTYHKAGTFDEIHPEGSRVDKIVGHNYVIVAKDNDVHIIGTCNVTIDSDCQLYVKGDLNQHVKGDWNIIVEGSKVENVSGNVTETYSGVHSRIAGAAVLDKAGLGHVTMAGGVMTHLAPMITLN